MVIEVTQYLKGREQTQLTVTGTYTAAYGWSNESEPYQITLLVLDHERILGSANQGNQMLHVLNLLGRERHHTVKLGKRHVDYLHSLAYVGTHLLHVTELLD